MIIQKAYDQISNKVNEVPKISITTSGSIDIFVKHHLEDSVDDKKFVGESLAKKAGIRIRASRLSALLERNTQKCT